MPCNFGIVIRSNPSILAIAFQQDQVVIYLRDNMESPLLCQTHSLFPDAKLRDLMPQPRRDLFPSGSLAAVVASKPAIADEFRGDRL